MNEKICLNEHFTLYLCIKKEHNKYDVIFYHTLSYRTLVEHISYSMPTTNPTMQVRVNNSDEGMSEQFIPVRLIASSSTGGWLTREAYRCVTYPSHHMGH